MAFPSTVFTPRQTVISSDWLNAVNTHSAELVYPEDFGARGNGVDDDTTSINNWLAAGASGLQLTGYNGKTYAVAGNITLPAIVRMRRATFKQLTPLGTLNRRTLYQSGGTLCELEGVTVNRNGDGSGGGLLDAAGIFIADSVGIVRLTDCEVYGNDYGNGIIVIRCDNAEIIRPYVHDITGGTTSSAAVTDDTVQGVCVLGGKGVRIDNPRVKNLLNRWSGKAAFNRFSRGIAMGGGTKQFSINVPFIDNVDQGIDVTSDEDPEFYSIVGGIVSNCYTWGHKAANSVQNGVYTGCVAYRCGIAGFVASSANYVEPHQTQKITYTGCHSVATGYGGAWSGLATTAGFRTGANATYPDYPRQIKWIGCTADGTGGAMEIGFHNEGALGSANGETWTEAIHCAVNASTIRDFNGINSGFVSRSRITTVSHTTSGAWQVVAWDNTLKDYMVGTASGSATATAVTRSGVWQVSVAIYFANSATGNRGVRLLVDGSVQIAGGVFIAAVSGSATYATFTTAISLPAGSLVTFEAYQNSGGALNIESGSGMQLTLVSAGIPL